MTLERMPSFQYEVKYGLYSKNLVYYEFWSALTFINDNMFQKIRLSVVPVFLLEEQPHTLSQVLKSNLRGSGEGRETLWCQQTPSNCPLLDMLVSVQKLLSLVYIL